MQRAFLEQVGQGGFWRARGYEAAMPLNDADWETFADVPIQPIAQLFGAEAQRLESLSIECAGIYFDFSKTHLGEAHLRLLPSLTDSGDLPEAQERLFTGQIVNPTEGRASEHPP